MNDSALPRRAGDRPRTYLGTPHTQLDQHPDARIRAHLRRRFGGFPDVEEQPTGIGAPGARALCLVPGVAVGPADAFLVGREFAHLHALPDSSLHLALPLALATDVVEAGWGEFHPLAGAGLAPANTVLIYAPRDAAEVDVVLEIVQWSYDYARGARTA